MKKLAIAAAAIAALAAVFYLTKPGPPSPRVAEREESALPDIPSYRAPTRLAGQDGGAGDAGSGPTAASVPVAKHGADAVVRSRDEGGKKAAARARPRYPADWDHPVDLPFRELKKLRREYRNGDFSQETIRRLSGGAVKVRGAIMPIDPVGEEGVLKRFWVVNTVIVMAGCVFCFPPTMGDLVYVNAGEKPYEVDREKLYRSIVRVEALGRLELGPNASADGVEYMFGLDLEDISD